MHAYSKFFEKLDLSVSLNAFELQHIWQYLIRNDLIFLCKQFVTDYACVRDAHVSIYVQCEWACPLLIFH